MDIIFRSSLTTKKDTGKRWKIETRGALRAICQTINGISTGTRFVSVSLMYPFQIQKGVFERILCFPVIHSYFSKVRHRIDVYKKLSFLSWV